MGEESSDSGRGEGEGVGDRKVGGNRRRRRKRRKRRRKKWRRGRRRRRRCVYKFSHSNQRLVSFKDCAVQGKKTEKNTSQLLREGFTYFVVLPLVFLCGR